MPANSTDSHATHSSYPHPVIAREGWWFIAFTFIFASCITMISPAFSMVFWIIFCFAVQFFRDPPRKIPTTVNHATVLSPADGRIVVIEKVHDPYAQREALKISVFMNVLNVHSNRSPVDGIIEKIQYFPGKFLNASIDKASENNERNALMIRTKSGQIVTCVQIAGLIARRILCYVQTNNALRYGQRYGFIRFGSRVDLYLPLNAVPKVVVGDKVSATETILAEMMEKNY